MKTLQELKQQQEDANSQLFNECGLFFAFSKEQFEANKTPLKEGEKYAHFGGGGYLPKSNVDKLIEGLETNKNAYQQEVKKQNLRIKEIVYELGNHECFYTGDWSPVAELFPDVKPEVIRKIYKAEHKKYLIWCKQTGNN